MSFSSFAIAGSTSHSSRNPSFNWIPGVSKITASAIIAEIGVNMNQFQTADHLASWTGVAPGNYESAGKKSSKTVKGNPHVKTALCEAAWAATISRKLSDHQTLAKLHRRRSTDCNFSRGITFF
ncbi:IS110 family transposase [Paenibacillus paeoniae]|uniref:IS110 family transposase n=1 Tax=Paenibacillus paeoniae TaxID=2292705 RepID=A0A371PH79_9BACL|nr:IS110 family transposase [Paenibacillus paeoniae]